MSCLNKLVWQILNSFSSDNDRRIWWAGLFIRQRWQRRMATRLWIISDSAKKLSKKRYSSHLCSFRHERYRSSTELSKYVWQLKEKGTDFAISWSVCQKATPYSSGSKRCQLCLAEKLCIISAEPKLLLNKKAEIVSTCRHRRKFLLSTHASPAT